MSAGIKTAFVLGAGLGTRLMPLTGVLPKPLVPVFNKPLITFAFDHLIASGVERFVVNTHHLPGAYGKVLCEKKGRAEYRGCPTHFRHEPVLLETGGGIKNAADLIGDSDFFVYNGDVLAAFPLEPLFQAHTGSGNIATLALRSSGGERRVQFDGSSGLVTDLRGIIGGRTEPSFLFTGVSIFSPEIYDCIQQGEVISIVPVLADLIRKGARVGGVVIDEGGWFDIGTPQAYLDVHREISAGGVDFGWLPEDWIQRVGPGAAVAESVILEGCSTIGSDAVVGENAVLVNTVVWSGSNLPAGVRLENSIIAPGFRVP